MKKIKKIIIVICLLVITIPYYLHADSGSKANVYVFYGEECAFCNKAFEFFDTIKDNYNFDLYKYEVWSDENNNELMNNIAEALGKETLGVPYIIIGEKVFNGYNDTMNSEIVAVIQEESNNNNKNDFVSKYLMSISNSGKESTEKKEEFSNKYIILIVSIITVAGISVLITLLLRKARKTKENKKINSSVKNTKTRVINEKKRISSFKKIIHKLLGKKAIVISALIGIAIAASLLFCFIYKPSLESIKDSVVMIEAYDENNELVSTGSGFCAVKSNYIVTNYHVIKGAYKLKIVTDDNSSHNIKRVVIFDYENDLAILEILNTNLKPIRLGLSSSLKTGASITTIGSPLGELNTVSTGIISNADNSKGIQISAPISHGSSGGVLLNKNYRAIGITYAGIEEGQNLNYAIDVKYLKDMIKSLRKKEYTTIVATNSMSYFKAREEGKTLVDRCYKDETSKLSFVGCNGVDDKYYSAETTKDFYDVTSIYSIYDNMMTTGTIALNGGKDYAPLSSMKKKIAAEYYENISFENDINDTNIGSMAPYEIIHSITEKEYDGIWPGTSKFIIANTLADISDVNDSSTCFNKVSTKFLDREEKIMFDFLYCGYNAHSLSSSDNDYFINYINGLNISLSKKEEILSYFGYSVVNGRVYY